MKFKGEENKLIWESYTDNYFSDGLAETELPQWVSEFDVGDLAAGVYWWTNHNHGGRSSDGYQALSIIGRYYRPGRISNGPEPESGEEFVYDQISSEEEALAIANYVKQQMESEEEDAEEDFDDDFNNEMSDDFGDDEMGDDFNEPTSQSMVMEIEPMAPVEPHEVNEVLVSELKKLAEYAQRLYDMKDSADFEDWMVSAVTIASTYVSDVWHRLDAKADFANTGFEQSADFNNF